jgi:hypothetical protein
MTLKVLFFVSLVSVAISMAAGWAHLLEMHAKLGLSRDDYLTVQQIYRGWALLGVVVFAALGSALWLAVATHRTTMFVPCLIAACAVAGSLAVFFMFTFPANQATANWTLLPADWMVLRRNWEYSHAIGAILYFVALTSLVVALLRRVDTQSG